MGANKLRIIGKGPSSLTVNFDWDGDTWGLNDLYAHRPYVPSIEFDIWWELHSHDDIDSDHLRRINKIADPDHIYVHPAIYDNSIDNLVEFDMNAFAHRRRDYFTSSIAWMIAKSIHVGNYSVLKLPGVDMLTKEEYFRQRPCIEYWIGRAEAQGMTVKTMAKSTLLQGENYPESRSEE